VDFLKINQISNTSDAIDYFYSNAPFSWIVGVCVILILVLISARNVKEYVYDEVNNHHRQQRKSVRQWIIEYGFPILCGLVVIAFTYHSNHLTASASKAEMKWQDKRFFTYFTPDTRVFKIGDIVGLRIEQVRKPKNNIPGIAEESPSGYYFIFIDLHDGDEIRISSQSSKDKSIPAALAEELGAFIRNHPNHQHRRLYIRD